VLLHFYTSITNYIQLLEKMQLITTTYNYPDRLSSIYGMPLLPAVLFLFFCYTCFFYFWINITKQTNLEILRWLWIFT